MKHRANSNLHLCDDQAVGVPHVHQVVKLIVFNWQNDWSQIDIRVFDQNLRLGVLPYHEANVEVTAAFAPTHAMSRGSTP